jgi:hypothetical protein
LSGCPEPKFLRLIDILVDELKLTSTFVGDIPYYPDACAATDINSGCLGMIKPQSTLQNAEFENREMNNSDEGRI